MVEKSQIKKIALEIKGNLLQNIISLHPALWFKKITPTKNIEKLAKYHRPPPGTVETQPLAEVSSPASPTLAAPLIQNNLFFKEI